MVMTWHSAEKGTSQKHQHKYDIPMSVPRDGEGFYGQYCQEINEWEGKWSSSTRRRLNWKREWTDLPCSWEECTVGQGSRADRFPRGCESPEITGIIYLKNLTLQNKRERCNRRGSGYGVEAGLKGERNLREELSERNYKQWMNIY